MEVEVEALEILHIIKCKVKVANFILGKTVTYCYVCV